MTEPAPSDGLPDDPDLEVDTDAAGSPRPVHLHPGFLALVLGGGAVGTAAREALSLAVPRIDGIPVAILGVNLVGAFLLGLLLEALVHRGPDHGRRRIVRLLLGTGVMGGFTTYSALAADTALLMVDGSAVSAALYGLATVLLGALATWLGIVLAAGSRRSRAAVPETGAAG